MIPLASLSTALILLVAGSGRRMNIDENKILLELNGKPIFIHALESFIKSGLISTYVIVCRPQDEAQIRKSVDQTDIPYTLVYGGEQRQDSVYNGLSSIKNTCEYVMVHDGARPFVTTETILKCAESMVHFGSGVAGVPVYDTIKQIDNKIITKTLDRNQLIAIQTPQCFRVETLLKAHKKAKADHFCGTDESILIERMGRDVHWVFSEQDNRKITTMADIKYVNNAPFIGHGMDVHAFAENRKLIIGGVDIPFEKGLAGHSDADVLTHAIMDALLGAAGLADIGQQFPDSDNAYKNANSLDLLKETHKLIKASDFSIQNIDCTLVLQQPKVGMYIQKMRENIMQNLNISLGQINIKATTSEWLGFTGRGEGVAAFAVCLLNH